MVKSGNNLANRSSKSARQAFLDEALSMALATKIPEKNTGPDLDDVLSLEEAEQEREQKKKDRRLQRADTQRLGEKGEVKTYSIELDEAEHRVIEKILDVISCATGERPSVQEAIRVALVGCSFDEKRLEQAYQELLKRK